MTQQEKDLLLKDLCPRLPYGLKVHIYDMDYPAVIQAIYVNLDVLVNDIQCYSLLFECKPYLRPMSSMTKEEENEYKMFIDYSYNDFTSESFPCVYVDKINDYLDWLNAHQFDYRGLIPMGLALPATEGIYNIK